MSDRARDAALTTAASGEDDRADAAEGASPEPHDFVIAAGRAAQIADVLASLPAPERERLLHRVHALRGNRIAHEVEAALMRRAEPLESVDEAGFDLAAAEAAVIGRDVDRARDVAARLFRVSPHAMGVALLALHRRGRLDDLLEPLPHGYARALEARLPSGHDFGPVRSRLRPYFEDRDETDHSVTGLLRGIPYAGEPLAFAFDGLTFGFASEHDAAYRAKRTGAITEQEYVERSDAAGARAVAVGTMSIATGGVAGSYAGGLMAETAAAGTAGRMTSAIVTGGVGGAGAGLGAQLGSDAVSGQLSGADQYLHSAAVGAGFGAAGGSVAGAASETAALLPVSTQSALGRLVQRFPAHADVFDHYRALGESHAVTLRASRLHQLLADGAAAVAQPELAAAVAGLAPDSLVSVTGRLDDRGLTVMHAEQLDDAGGKVKTRGRAEDQLSAVGRSNPSPLTADELARIESYQAERNAFLKTWRELDTAAFPQPTRDLLFGKADRAIRKNMTPDDLSAVIKERRGDVILKPDGRPYDHITEYREARRAVLNALDAVDERLKLLETQSAMGGEVEVLSAKRRDLSKLIDGYEKMAGGAP